MIEIEENELRMIRGNTVRINLRITDSSGNAYALQEGDIITFTAKQSIDDETAVISKTVSDGCIALEPQDTATLSPRTYVYDVVLETSDGDVFTVIPPSPLCLLPGVRT